MSLSAQHSANSAIFYLLDGTPADSQFAGVLPSLTAILPHSLHLVDYRGVDEIMQQLQFIREWGGRFVVPIPEVAVY